MKTILSGSEVILIMGLKGDAIPEDVETGEGVTDRRLYRPNVYCSMGMPFKNNARSMQGERRTQRVVPLSFKIPSRLISDVSWGTLTDRGADLTLNSTAALSDVIGRQWNRVEYILSNAGYRMTSRVRRCSSRRSSVLGNALAKSCALEVSGRLVSSFDGSNCP